MTNHAGQPVETVQSDVPSPECGACRLRREKYQAMGLTIFMISLCSCGTLTFIAIPTGAVLQLLALRKCPACRQQTKI